MNKMTVLLLFLQIHNLAAIERKLTAEDKPKTTPERIALFRNYIYARSDDYYFNCNRPISVGANPNAPGIEDIILHKAVLDNSIERVRFLLEHKADPNVSGPDRITPLFNASTVEMVKLLVKYGAEKKVRSCDGYSLFAYAVTQHHNKESADLVRHYLDIGAGQVDETDDGGDNALHYLANPVNWLYKNKDTQKILLQKAQVLISAGVPLTKNKLGKTAIQLLELYTSPLSKESQEKYAITLLSMINAGRERRNKLGSESGCCPRFRFESKEENLSWWIDISAPIVHLKSIDGDENYRD